MKKRLVSVLLSTLTLTLTAAPKKDPAAFKAEIADMVKHAKVADVIEEHRRTIENLERELDDALGNLCIALDKVDRSEKEALRSSLQAEEAVRLVYQTRDVYKNQLNDEKLYSIRLEEQIELYKLLLDAEREKTKKLDAALNDTSN